MPVRIFLLCDGRLDFFSALDLMNSFVARYHASTGRYRVTTRSDYRPAVDWPREAFRLTLPLPVTSDDETRRFLLHPIFGVPLLVAHPPARLPVYPLIRPPTPLRQLLRGTTRKSQ